MGLRVGEVVQVPPLLKNLEARKVCLQQAMQVVRITGSRNGLPMPHFVHFKQAHAWTFVKNLRFTCVTMAVHVSAG